MDLLEVALQVIAIIAIIAVGAFIIVFLSDLLISIIDDHQGIFFRRNKGKEENYQNTRVFEDSYQNTNQDTFQNTKTANKSVDSMATGFEFEFDDAPIKQEVITEKSFAKKNTVDFEAAKKEQEMIERANQNFFDDEDKDEEETKEELEQKERIAKLEERNKLLEQELNQKAQNQTKKETPKFEDLSSGFNQNDLDETEEDDFDEDGSDDYEKLIKQINQQVKAEFEKLPADTNAKTAATHFVDSMIDEEDEEIEEDEEDDFDTEEKEIEEDEETGEDKYSNLTQELAKLKEELENERKEREQLRLESKEIAEKLIEEKQALEEALKVKKKEETESKQGVVLLGSEEEYVARLEVLEDRLKEAKKQLRKNKREFVPLNKIKRTLEKDQVKLRRKEAQVAKQKVALFGVNNSDIDPVKQAELEQEIDMLEGLKLSVQHCEDVMRESADRYPVLEQTHSILTKNVKNLASDIESIEAKLKEIRKKKA